MGKLYTQNAPSAVIGKDYVPCAICRIAVYNLNERELKEARYNYAANGVGYVCDKCVQRAIDKAAAKREQALNNVTSELMALWCRGGDQ